MYVHHFSRSSLDGHIDLGVFDHFGRSSLDGH